MAWKLAQSPKVTQMWCAPGNAGIAEETLATNDSKIECVAIGAEDLPSLVAFAHEVGPDLIVVGPDNPLAMGIVDLFQSEGFRIWGPNRKAAQFEASKVFAQDFMKRHGIPTAAAESFDDPVKAKEFAATLGGRCAVKADGLALGKGVLVCRSVDEANAAIDEIMVSKAFGDAGGKVVIQELQEGLEASLHAFVDGVNYLVFPSSQDHKPAYDGDEGPNTGGMGTYSPAPFLDDEKIADAARLIIEPWIKGCQAEGIDYRGLLYPGIFITESGPKVIEFNSRFGDPETQVYLTRLENDLVDLMEACIDQSLAEQTLRWKSESSVCVVLASGGYPGSYEKEKPIAGLEAADESVGVKVFHAGTKRDGDEVVTAGGRVLGVTALGSDLGEARHRAYEAADKITFEGKQFRTDIAKKGLRP